MQVSKNIKFVIIILLLCTAAYFSWTNFFSQYVEDVTVSIHEFPMIVGEWVGKELPISENDLAILETTNAFMRKYSKPSGEYVMLYIVYSEKNRRVSHPPEICYSGGGITILSNEPVDIEDMPSDLTLRIRRMLVESGRFQQVASYWFKVGDTYTANYYKQQFLIAYKTLLRKPASSAMIRIAADVHDENIDSADELIKEFAFEILPLLPTYLP